MKMMFILINLAAAAFVVEGTRYQRPAKTIHLRTGASHDHSVRMRDKIDFVCPEDEDLDLFKIDMSIDPAGKDCPDLAKAELVWRCRYTRTDGDSRYSIEIIPFSPIPGAPTFNFGAEYHYYARSSGKNTCEGHSIQLRVQEKKPKETTRTTTPEVTEPKKTTTSTTPVAKTQRSSRARPRPRSEQPKRPVVIVPEISPLVQSVSPNSSQSACVNAFIFGLAVLLLNWL
ncbi:Oidioi.mRNA.OKI2018_I69.XSR.g13494.t1.cds [Oikopleura dioica]|uniref:Oidioi.mRNA.OKI2018_I69.XSR.g13494.t1.cds n=1 Tax=Oikopleura dioica TaxID=34765 RepID=A0ABN7SAR4_OIKDI|nr:Oidioi.mRNA.OKI2018_I69.XSR.g13494.t1.cds [Oikopleura dioica]